MNHNEPINTSSLVMSVIVLILGIVLCFGGMNVILDLSGYVVGGILVLAGIIRFITGLVSSKRDNTSGLGSIISSIIIVGVGIFVAFRSDVIVLTLSLMIGAFLIFMSIQRLILGIAVRKVDKTGSTIFLVEAIVVMLVGVVILTQKFSQMLGLFLIIYAISELVSYIYYTTQHKDYSSVLNKKVTKEMKESEAKDAIIEEE